MTRSIYDVAASRIVLTLLLLLLACLPVLASGSGLVAVSMVLFAGLALLAVPQGVWPWWQRALRGWRAPIVGVALYVSLWLLFFAVYPALNANTLGLSSSADDMLNTGGAALMEGLFPYDYGTETGLPISQFPGALVLAVPLVALGNAALLPLVALLPFFASMRAQPGASSARVLLVLVLAFALLPHWLGAVLAGDDLPAWSMLIQAAASMLLLAQRRLVRTFWAALLGVLLSSYLWLWLMLPALWMALRERGQGSARTESPLTLGIVLLAAAAITLPWWWQRLDAQFMPWLMQHSQLSNGGWLLVLGSAGLAGLLVRKRQDFAWAAAWACTLAELGLRIVESVRAGAPQLEQNPWTSTALVFAIAAWALPGPENSKDSP